MNQVTSCPCTLSHAALATLLPELGILSFGGADREHFLQGQLTNDMRNLGNRLVSAGYCNPQGRLLSIFRLFAHGDEIWAVVPKESIAGLSKRLRMYVLRSKVTITEITEYRVWGVLQNGCALPVGSDSQLFSLSDGTEEVRKKLQLPQGRSLWIGRNAPQAQPIASNLFWMACAAAGDPFVFEATKALFVPQAVNLELAHGVSFTKGCYTGQEIVSRVEHIGKTPRRAGLFATTGELTISPGTPVTLGSDTEAGTVLYAGAWQGKTVALIQVANANLESTGMTLQGASLYPLPLPYTFAN